MTTTEGSERLEQLFREHFRALLAYALRRVDDPADAADVVSEAYLAAWRRLDQVPPGPEARLWLFGTARRVLANHHRGSGRRGALAERLRGELATLARADEPDDGTSALVREAMGALKADDREVLSLVCWEGLDPAEAAAVLGVPPATARTRLHRARRRLRRELARRGWDADASAPPLTSMETVR